MTAIEAVAQKYQDAGKTLELRHLSKDCHRLLRRAGQLVTEDADDPEYGVAVDYGVRTGMMNAGH